MTAIEVIILLIECFGTAAFAVSGTLMALRKKTDVFGTLIMALTTSFGGGLIRDITIDRTPAALFTDKDCRICLFIAISVSIIVMLLAHFDKTAKFILKHSDSLAINIIDALGLSVFCVIGVNSAIKYEYENHIFFLSFAGTITAIGGGILRDIFIGEVPIVFKKNVYALPTILGSFAYIYLLKVMSTLFAMGIVIVFITVIRTLAAKFHWNLPVAYKKLERLENESKNQ